MLCSFCLAARLVRLRVICIEPLCRSVPVILRLAALLPPIWCFAPLASPLSWSGCGVVYIELLSRSAPVILLRAALMPPNWRGWSVKAAGCLFESPDSGPLCYAPFASPLGWSGCGVVCIEPLCRSASVICTSPRLCRPYGHDGLLEPRPSALSRSVALPLFFSA